MPSKAEVKDITVIKVRDIKVAKERDIKEVVHIRVDTNPPARLLERGH